ncbi:MAG: PDZ domain-containing protein [Anaerolineae bacterium]
MSIGIPLGRTAITLGASWLVVVPIALWAIATIYVPILGAFLNGTEAWAIAVAIALLIGVSLIGHAAGHVWAARALHSDVPSSVPLCPLGDAAQVWPAATSAWREALVAIAGSFVNLLMVGLAYLLWDAQLNPAFNVITFFLIFFNGGLAAINLTPAFPLDGGRLMRAVVWGLLDRPAPTTRLGMWLGLLISALLTGWGIFLIAQRVHFSLQTGVTTIVFAGLIVLGLSMQQAWKWDRPVPVSHSAVPGVLIRAPLAGLLILGMLGVTFSLVPTNNGLEAPGIAVPVEPMVEVPPQHRYPSTGAFFLTTVIPQTPITAGEWVVGQLSPAVKIVPPEQIVPPGTTAQALAQQEYQMLDESETTATVEGLRLAGYDAAVEGKGARVVSILPDSPAKGVLQPGDVIISLNGQSIRTTSELTNQLMAQDAHATVTLQIERDGRKMDLAVPLMPPSKPGQPPRIGILVESAGFSVQLPFPVEIVPQKISGGPSAGLMFTLTVYNMVTPEDLTGGRKIAGTGTISLDGTVGPIGGVQQKVAGAEIAGAEYFLSPPENYADARAVARHIQVVKVDTAEQAIQFLRSLPPIEGSR